MSTFTIRLSAISFGEGGRLQVTDDTADSLESLMSAVDLNLSPRPMTSCLIISARPDARISAGSVLRKSASMTTSRGAWNAPARFLPSGRSHPVLPPVDASTIARSVVGTFTQSMPRIQVAAAKPVRSLVTPPPNEHTTSLRPSPFAANAFQSPHTVSIVLCCSPLGIQAKG